MIPYGAPIHASDIERYAGQDPAAWLTSLGRSLLQAALAAEGLHAAVPEVTDRIRVADGGVDASLLIDVPLANSGITGLLNPGRTIYQFKWRSRREDIFAAARGELKKLTPSPDHYVFITNVGLAPGDHDRMRDALRHECEAFTPERIAVLGASELADRVNLDPRIRLTHFGVGLSLCTLAVARDAGERRYGNVSAPTLFDRDHDLGALRALLGDPQVRAGVIFGPQGVGKSRVVAEVLASVPERVVWAREVPSQPIGLLQVLDDSGRPTILVVDDADSDADVLLRKASEARQLKTLIISTFRVTVPGALVLQVKPLDARQADSLLETTFPTLSPSDRGWLYDQFGGVPGLLLPAATALSRGVHRDPLREPRYDELLGAYEDRMTRGLATSAVEALSVLSVLPRFSLGDRGYADLQVVSGALGTDVSSVLRYLDLLTARGLIDRAGYRDDGLLRVTPPLLARRLARRVLAALAAALPRVYERLSLTGRVELVQRAAELAEEPAVRSLLGALFSDGGLFKGIESLIANAAAVRALAECLPLATGPRLRRLLEATSPDAIDQLSGDARRETVSALEYLVFRHDTFDDAARGLLHLAAAENERWANNATGLFKKLFHWRRIDIPKDARLRAQLLVSLGTSASGAQRYVVAQAAAHALDREIVLYTWQGQGATPPEAGWRASRWEEVQDAIGPIVRLLKQLAVDDDPAVRGEAITGLARGTMGVLAVGMAEEAIASLEFLATLALDGTQRVRLVEAVAFLVADVRQMISAAQTQEWKSQLKGALDRACALFVSLTSSDFRSRFVHWLGPTPMRAHRKIGHPADHDEVRRQASRLAKEVLREPGLLTAELLDWLTDEHAQNATYFLQALGEGDRDQVWLQGLEPRLTRPQGVFALGVYLAGRFISDAPSCEAYLDTAAGRGGAWSKAAADATWRIGGSARGAERLLRCVSEGGVDRAAVARQLSWARWDDALSIDQFVNLVRDLRDDSQNVDWALLDTVHGRWLARPNDSDALGPLSESLLLDTASDTSPQREIYHWDSLAAAVAKWSIDAGLRLLLAHLGGERAGLDISLVYHRRELLEALSSSARPQVVACLVDASLTARERWRLTSDLPHLLHLPSDAPTLLRLADEHGLEAARLIADCLDGSQSGLWQFLVPFVRRWGYDEEVRAGLLHSIIWIRGAYSNRAAILKPRLTVLQEFLRHPEPRVSELARSAEAALARTLETED